MSNADSTGFGKFVPGFDFLQNLAQGAAGGNSGLPNFGKWVAPTLDAEELDKRIEELKIVRFWLEQNTNALGATIQALEVQKMTLATLKGMNFSFGETAAAAKPQTAAKESADKEAKPQAGVIDPMQLWGSLTQQFQKIAESAVKEASGVAAHASKAAAASVEKAAAAASAATAASAAPAARAASRTAARKPARKTGKSK